MLKTTILAALFALGATVAAAQEGGGRRGARHVTDYAFSFEGPFGRFDQAQLQRGLQVYTEVCAACHGLKFMPYRELAERGRAGAARGPDARLRGAVRGRPTRRPARPGRRRRRTTSPPSSIENAPDLSLMAKARAGFHGPAGLGINQIIHGMGGPEYIATLLHGYTGEDREEAGATLYENTPSRAAGSRCRRRSRDDQVTYCRRHRGDGRADEPGRRGVPDVGRRADR